MGWLSELSDLGVLGINKRNACYTLPYNRRSLYPLVDDKLRTKELAKRVGLSVPELYGVVHLTHDVDEIRQDLSKRSDFVIKPACGSGGAGVMVIAGRAQELFRSIQGTLFGWDDLRHHMFNILGGVYSLAGQPDKVLIEYRVRTHPALEGLSFHGVPDIRIIVFLGVPVMAMLRLPTSLSRGRANLHQGAVGVGIDISSGMTTYGVWRDRAIQEHPDSGMLLAGAAVPEWQKLLCIASQCYELTGLGYQGVDLVLDSEGGPMMLEINARPGLNIQIANKAGLLKALEAVERSASMLTTTHARVSFAQEACCDIAERK